MTDPIADPTSASRSAPVAGPRAEGPPGGPTPREVLDRLLPLARHGVNNLSMVLSVNMDAALDGLSRAPDQERALRQVERAAAAARGYDATVRGLLALSRAESLSRPRAAALLEEVRPLLELAARRRLNLETVPGPGGADPVLEVRRPAIDAALALLAMSMPPRRGEGADLLLDGSVLRPGWAIGGAEAVALRAAGCRIGGDGAIALPRPD